MGIVDWILRGGARRNLGLSIDGVAQVARATAETEGLDAQRTRLWNILCDSSRQTLHQLLIKNDDSRMDWGLKRHVRRVDDYRLVVLFWWMLLYQIVLFKNRGMGGFRPEDEDGPMRDVAQSFIETELARLGVGSDAPGPWAENRSRQFTLESAMTLYNRTYNLLGIQGDATRRIDHVSHFTTITERAYDRLTADLET